MSSTSSCDEVKFKVTQSEFNEECVALVCPPPEIQLYVTLTILLVGQISDCEAQFGFILIHLVTHSEVYEDWEWQFNNVQVAVMSQLLQATTSYLEGVNENPEKLWGHVHFVAGLIKERDSLHHHHQLEAPSISIWLTIFGLSIQCIWVSFIGCFPSTSSLVGLVFVICIFWCYSIELVASF